jgi:CBS domain-containing protein
MEATMRTTLVQDWMTSQLITATPETTLPEALQLMRARAIRRLPVCENGRLIGMVTRGDLRGAQPSEATSLSIFELHYLVGRITLNQIMTRHPVCVTPTTTIQDAASLMLERKIAGLPVMEQDQLVGIITESDIFRLVVKTWQQQDKLMPVAA